MPGEVWIKHIIKTIKAKRIDMDLTQEALAEKADISESTVTSIEGNKRNPTIGTLARICDALDLSAIELFQGMDQQDEKAEMPTDTYEIAAANVAAYVRKELSALKEREEKRLSNGDEKRKGQ